MSEQSDDLVDVDIASIEIHSAATAFGIAEAMIAEAYKADSMKVEIAKANSLKQMCFDIVYYNIRKIHETIPDEFIS